MIPPSYLCVGTVVKKNTFKSKHPYNVGTKSTETTTESIDNCVWPMKTCWYHGAEKPQGDIIFPLLISRKSISMYNSHLNNPKLLKDTVVHGMPKQTQYTVRWNWRFDLTVARSCGAIHEDKPMFLSLCRNC